LDGQPQAHRARRRCRGVRGGHCTRGARHPHLDSFLGSGDAVLAKINAAQGTLGRLVNDSSLYVGGDSLVAAMRELIAEIRANPKKFVSLKLF
jgi:hypothetical protein